MRKIIIYTFVLIGSQSVLAQSLSIDLSIVWKDKKSFCNIGRIKNRSSINTPYLTVKYKNLTDRKIYFFNGLGGDFKDKNHSELELTIPPKYVLSDMDMENALRQIDTTLFFSTYKVYINYLFDWVFEENKIHTDSSRYTSDSLINYVNDLQRFVYYEKEKKRSPSNYTVDSLVDYLSYIQDIFYYENKIAKISPNLQLSFFDNPNKRKMSIDEAREMIFEKDTGRYYSPSEINSGVFPIDIKNQLIFLKPQEEYIIQFDLIAFYLLGGHFIFYMKWENETNEALYSSYDRETESSWYHDISMPEEVNGYKYFTGSIIIAPVELKID